MKLRLLWLVMVDWIALSAISYVVITYMRSAP